jgi:poly(A) polymerase
VNQFILKHIYPNDMPAFVLALQCIKHWAKQRGIYNKPMGYLNGGSWTLLLVKTYFLKRSQSTSNNTLEYSQISRSARSSPLLPSDIESRPSSSASAYSTTNSASSSPTATPANAYLSPARTITFITLLESFYSIWSSWHWPDPVILTKSIPIIAGQPTSATNTLDNIEDFRDSLLPIVTPCYPVNNASPFVTQSTLTVMTKELQRADRILQSSDFARPTEMMDKFFKPLNLVKEYKHFIKVTVSCDTGKSHDIW